MATFANAEKVTDMSNLTAGQLRGLFDDLITEYGHLSGAKTKLEADCAQLRKHIETQHQQLQALSSEFEKLRQDYFERCPPPQPPPPQLASGPSAADDLPEWEIESLATTAKPLSISLFAEIVDLSVICSTAFSPDGRCVAIGSDKTLRVYDVERDEFAFQCQLEDVEEQATNHIRSIEWTRDGGTLVCSGEDGRVRVFSLARECLLKTIDVSTGEVFQVAVGHKSDFFAAVSGDGFLSMYRLSDYGRIDRLRRDANATLVATSVAISSDDKLIAVGYGDYHVALWDAEGRRMIGTSCCHASGVYAVKFVPGQQRLVTGSLDSTIKIWDLRWHPVRGAALQLYRVLEGHYSYVLALAVDPAGEILVSGSKDLTAKVSSLTRGVMLYSVKAHRNSVITVAFSPAGDRFCTGSGDRSVKIWTIAPETAA
jgi:WD40 repeat protein